MVIAFDQDIIYNQYLLYLWLNLIIDIEINDINISVILNVWDENKKFLSFISIYIYYSILFYFKLKP